jgi:hypothetical protein
MKRILLALLFFCGSAVLVSALEVQRSYEITRFENRLMDLACVSAFDKEVAPDFEGFTGIELSHPFAIGDQAGTYRILTYPGVLFQSEFGDVKGVINCVFLDGGTRLSLVSAAFERPGLAGARMRHPIPVLGDDPAELRRTAIGVEINP